MSSANSLISDFLHIVAKFYGRRIHFMLVRNCHDMWMMPCEVTNMIFINLSNHPSKYWGEKQRVASLKYGGILDYPFPAVDPRATSKDVNALADQISEDIVMKSPSAVMCQGEFTLTFAIVHRLQEKGIKVLSACTERHVSEETDESGRTSRKSVFEFVQYREYLY